jgi:hypothetical protein
MYIHLHSLAKLSCILMLLLLAYARYNENYYSLISRLFYRGRNLLSAHPTKCIFACLIL